MAKKTKTTKPKKTVRKISGGWRLLTQSFLDYRYNWRQVGGVALVAAAVNWLLHLTGDPATVPIFQGIWFVFVSCTLIWVIRHAPKPKSLKVRNIYWTGTAPALKLLLVFLVIALANIPFAIGTFVFGAIRSLGGGFTSESIVAAIWLIFALLSLLMFARLLPALIFVTLPEIGPGQAIGLSWRTTKGYTWNFSWRLAILFGFCVLALALIGLFLGALKLNPNWVTPLLEAAVFGLVMPLFYLFLFKLYKEAT